MSAFPFSVSSRQGAAIAILALVGAAALTGCGTVEAMRTAPVNEGVPRPYAGDYYEVTRAAYEAVQALGLHVEEVRQISPVTWHVIATSGASAFSWGELVRVSVQRRPTSHVAVWVLTRRRLATNFTARDDYSPEIFQRMDFTLSLRRSPAGPSAWAPTVVVPAPPATQ